MWGFFFGRKGLSCAFITSDIAGSIVGDLKPKAAGIETIGLWSEPFEARLKCVQFNWKLETSPYGRTRWIMHYKGGVPGQEL